MRFIGPGAKISGVAVACADPLRSRTAREGRALTRDDQDSSMELSRALALLTVRCLTRSPRLTVRRGSRWSSMNVLVASAQAFGPTCRDDLPSALRFPGRVLASESDLEAASKLRNHLRPDREG